jgi:hypothetical protein
MHEYMKMLVPGIYIFLMESIFSQMPDFQHVRNSSFHTVAHDTILLNGVVQV